MPHRSVLRLTDWRLFEKRRRDPEEADDAGRRLDAVAERGVEHIGGGPDGRDAGRDRRPPPPRGRRQRRLGRRGVGRGGVGVGTCGGRVHGAVLKVTSLPDTRPEPELDHILAPEARTVPVVLAVHISILDHARPTPGVQDLRWPGQLVVRVAKRQEGQERAPRRPEAGTLRRASCGCAARTTKCWPHKLFTRNGLVRCMVRYGL